MSSLCKLLNDLELVLTDMKVESMLADLIDHTSKADDYDDFTRIMARSRTISFICDHVKDFDMAFYHLSKYKDEHKKIDFASDELGGTTDEVSIPLTILRSESESSIL